MQKEKSYKKNSYFLNLLEKKMLPYCNKVAFIEKTELTNSRANFVEVTSNFTC
jgi:hypothetical protein